MLTPAYQSVLHSGMAAGTLLTEIVRLTGEQLGAHRCFLYVRQPVQRRGRIAFCWRKNESVPDVIQPDWQEDTKELPKEDPLFAAALAGKPSVYVEDVQTAPPDVLNRDFENHTFGHRALVHAHIFEAGQLWGILQPAMFGTPHQWTEHEKALIEGVLPHLVKVIKEYGRS